MELTPKFSISKFLLIVILRLAEESLINAKKRSFAMLRMTDGVRNYSSFIIHYSLNSENKASYIKKGTVQ